MPPPLKNQPGARRRVRLIGGYLPHALFQGIAAWTAREPERSLSGFLREAVREKLAGDGIAFGGPAALPPLPAPVCKPVSAPGAGGESLQISKN